MVMYFFRALYSWVNWLTCLPDQFFNYVQLRLFHVRYAAYPTIRGRLFIRSSGTIVLGSGVVINSKYSANPIGGMPFASIKIFYGGKLKIGNGVGIANSAICCSSSIEIEDNVLIGGNCAIYDTDFHSTKYSERTKWEEDAGIKISPILIKKGAFIGASSIILKGVTIGQNSIVGAGSVVTRSIPSNQIWGGNPATFLRELRHDELPQ